MQYTFASLCILASAIVANAQGPLGYASLNGGTTGGTGGSAVSVSTLAALQVAAKGNDRKVITITASINGAGTVVVGSNKTIKSKKGVSITGAGFSIKGVKNVILSDLTISKVKAAQGDAIGIQKSTNIWVDHCHLSSDLDHGKDYYDGLLDITHAGDFITVSNTKFSNHFKASLVGHSDNNGAEDRGHLRVTYHDNYFLNINSRAPSLRVGTGHIFNNVFENTSNGINTPQGAQVLVQNNVFIKASKPLYSTNGGFAVASGNDFGGASNAAPAGILSRAPYSVSLKSLAETRRVSVTAGPRS